MQLKYNVQDKPPVGQIILFALQQLLAILAATIAVPAIVGHGLTSGAALLGAGVGTIVYLLFTKSKSPVFLGSSFAFLGSLSAAFAGGVSASAGALGVVVGAAFAALVYVVIAALVKFAGTRWIDRIMPAVVIGPTVAIIGLSLAGNAIGDLMKGSVKVVHDLLPENFYMSQVMKDGIPVMVDGIPQFELITKQEVIAASPYLALLCGLVTLFVTIACSVYGKRMAKMIPFIIGILAGYALAAVFTAIGMACDIEEMLIIDWSGFANPAEWKWYPEIIVAQIFTGGELDFGDSVSLAGYIGSMAVAFVPVAFVVFAEHIADHKNISSIIEKDLLKEPGLHRTLLGDGVGSFVGTLFGCCPNTTYGESIGCVAISGNASVVTIWITALMAIACAFFAPFTIFLASIPACVMGGVCIALYGFIAVSGLKMVQKVDLNDNRNLFVVSVILIAGVGGMVVSFGAVTITEVACALILGIVTNILVNLNNKEN